jgi:thioredoxin-related protein
MISQRVPISKLMMIFLIAIFTTSCSTNKRLYRKIKKSLRLQNKIILNVKEKRSSENFVNQLKKNKRLHQNEKYLLMSLESIRSSNQAIIKKLNHNNKGTTKSGK